HNIRELFDSSGTTNLALPVLVDHSNHSNVQLHAKSLELGADFIQLLSLITRLVGHDDTKVVKYDVLAPQVVHVSDLVQDFVDVIGPEVVVNHQLVGVDNIIKVFPEVFLRHHFPNIRKVQGNVSLNGHQPKGRVRVRLLKKHQAYTRIRFLLADMVNHLLEH